MSNIKAELHAQSIPLYSIRLIEALRVFDLIQQNVPQANTVLSLGNLSSFLEKFFSPQLALQASKLLHQLNPNNQELINERFAAGLVKCLKNVELTNQQSLIDFYNRIKEVLCLTYQKPLEQYERWDTGNNMTPQMLQDRKNNIANFYNEMQSFIEGMELYTFHNHLEKLNYCLSVMSISNIESEILNVYKKFINPTVMNHISDFLATIAQLELNQQLENHLLQSILLQKQNVASYFALIAHFYLACKYRELRQRLETKPCLFYHETFKTIILGLKIPDIKIQRNVAICLSMMSENEPMFNDWILSDMLNNLMPVLNAVSKIKDDQTSYYTLICLKNILKRQQKRTGFVRDDTKNQQMSEKIQSFSLYVLGNYNNIDLQKQCFLLIAEIIKVGPLNSKQIEELKLTTKVFEIQIDFQVILVPAVLSILEASIHRKINEITNMIINDPAFLVCLQTHFGIKESLFFYQFLHIVYLLSYTHTNFLFEKNLLSKTLDLMFEDTNPTVSSIGSDILLNAILQGLQNQQILEILYDKLLIFDRVIPFLFKKCFAKSDYLTLLIIKNNNIPEYNYFDKYILNNFFKILYSLAAGVNRKHKKYSFLKRVNEEIINSISKILDDLFKSENRCLIEIVLRDKIKINSKRLQIPDGIQLFKAISYILELLACSSQNRPVPVLRTINRQFHSFGQNLLKSQFFTLHELQIQKISIFIKIIIEYDDKKFMRVVSHKSEFSALKEYAKKLVGRGVIDRNISDVKDVILKYKQSGRIIENDVQYRTLVTKALQNRVTEFDWQIHDISWRHRRDDAAISSFIMPNYEGGMRSFLEPNQFTTNRMMMNGSRHVPNFGMSRMNNTVRQNMGEMNGRRAHSPHIFNYTYERARSPQFGGSVSHRNR